MKDIRICSVETNGPIKELGNITGPIRKCRLPLPKVVSMINNGHVIYELNPKNLSERVRLTLTNVTPSPFSEEVYIDKKIEINKNKVIPEVFNGVVIGTEIKNDLPLFTVNHLQSDNKVEESKSKINAAQEVVENVLSKLDNGTTNQTEDVVKTDIKNTQPQYQQNYSKHDKKNKHKHQNNNQNYRQNVQNTNGNVSSKSEPTVEEKVVGSDF